MKVVLGLLGVAVIAAATWFVFFSPSNDYEVIVIDEVTQLEEELAALDTAVTAGTLTSAQADEARARIATRLNQITASMNGAENAKLTAGQRLQLQTGLRQLQDILVRYRDTLVAVDAKATKSSNGSSKSIVSQFVETIDSVEETVDEVVDEYTEDVTVSNVIDQIDEEIPDTVEEIIEAVEETLDDAASSTEDVVDDSISDDTDTEISTETEISSETDVTVDDSAEETTENN